MKASNENQQQGIERVSKKKAVLKTVGIVLSFYILATIISAFVGEENFRTQFILLILPTIATIVYGYRNALEKNYLILKTIFILLLVLEVIKMADRMISRMI